MNSPYLKGLKIHGWNSSQSHDHEFIHSFRNSHSTRRWLKSLLFRSTVSPPKQYSDTRTTAPHQLVLPWGHHTILSTNDKTLSPKPALIITSTGDTGPLNKWKLDGHLPPGNGGWKPPGPPDSDAIALVLQLYSHVRPTSCGNAT